LAWQQPVCLLKKERVILTGRNQKTLDTVAKELGANAVAFQADVLDSQARKTTFAAIQKKFGHLDIVFANAGQGEWLLSLKHQKKLSIKS
jgi:NADP-dependent 3-hydroxy acid dehydrogenase YdfG